MFNDPYNPYVGGGAGFGRGTRARGGRGGGYPAGPYAFGPGRGRRGRGGRGGAFAAGPFYGPGQGAIIGGSGLAPGAFGAGSWSAAGPRRGGLTRFALLGLLKSDGPRNGAQLIQALTERSYGRWYPNPALIYATLQQLEDEGLVTSASTEPGTGRAYELTDAGTQSLEQLGAQSSPWAATDGGFVSLRQAIFATVAAIRQIGVTGDAEVTAKATELLDQARKGIYRLLSGEAE
jgi:DNA-binding PadR family transcriptional regulator